MFKRPSIRLAEAIHSLVQYVKKRNWIGMFTVPAGSGKTVALEAIVDEVPGAILITVRRGKSRAFSFLQLWAESLRINACGRSGDIQDRIISHLLMSKRLHLIDEAHKLSVDALDAIREVWDAARVPIVMAATPVLYENLHGRRVSNYTREIMDQLSSRVRVFRDLTELEGSDGRKEPRYNVADIRKVFERRGVRLASDAAKWLCGVALLDGAGGLRGCQAMVQLAVDLFPGELLTIQLLKTAAGACFNREELERFAVLEPPVKKSAASA